MDLTGKNTLQKPTGFANKQAPKKFRCPTSKPLDSPPALWYNTLVIRKGVETMTIMGILGFLGMVVGAAGYVLLGSLWAALAAGVGLGMITASWVVMTKEDKANEEKLGIPAWMKEVY